ncbi:MAG: hypothetical protein AAGG09_12010, partial [Pseudomonadota bacterium]
AAILRSSKGAGRSPGNREHLAGLFLVRLIERPGAGPFAESVAVSVVGLLAVRVFLLPERHPIPQREAVKRADLLARCGP